MFCSILPNEPVWQTRRATDWIQSIIQALRGKERGEMRAPPILPLRRGQTKTKNKYVSSTARLAVLSFVFALFQKESNETGTIVCIDSAIVI
jgi:hypothetical protein